MALVLVPSTLTYLPRGMGGGLGDETDPFSGADVTNLPGFSPTPLPFTPGGIDYSQGISMPGDAGYAMPGDVGYSSGGAGSGITADVLHAGTAIAGDIARNLTIPSGFSQQTTCDRQGRCVTSMSKQAAGFPIGTQGASLQGNLGIGGLGSPMMLLIVAAVALFAFSKK